jgi:hypothetical protein
MTTCPKCGYARQSTDTKPEYECPQCGVIYARYVEAQERQQEHAAIKAEQATLRAEADAKKRSRNAIIRKVAPWIIWPSLIFALVRWGGMLGMGILFLLPLAVYFFKHRNDTSPSATASCPSCGGLVAIGVKSCPHCGHKKPYAKPASKTAVTAAYLLAGVTIYLIAFQPPGGRRVEDGISAYVICENLVKSGLKSPSTAQFAGYSNSTVTNYEDRKFHVKSHVDAKNSFGATLRNRYECVVDFTVDSAKILSMN